MLIGNNMSTIQQHTLVLIHGWGCDSSTWQPILEKLQYSFNLVLIDLPGFGTAPAIENYSLENLLSIMSAQIPDGSWVMGWSLGGMLAAQLAYRFPQKISGVISLAANARFVATADYPEAMSLKTNQEFNQSFFANPASALKVFSGLLAQGAVDERSLLKKNRSLISPEKVNSDWFSALILLSEMDNRKVLAEIKQPCLHLLADGDSLVPVSAAKKMQQISPLHQVEVIAHSSHALHWCHPELTAQHVCRFVESHSSLTGIVNQKVFKSRVAKKFSKAVSSYDHAAGVQRRSGHYLLENFAQDIQLNDMSVVMDLGCGTGYFLNPLKEKFGNISIVGVDLSLSMLSIAKQKAKVNFVAGDAEGLPFADQSIDLIYSNFALQWCFNLPLLFSELYRVMKPGAELIFTTLGNETLHELRSAWKQVDDQKHVNSFVDQAVLVGLLESRFPRVTFDRQLMQVQFDNPHELLHSLKSVGATYHESSSKGLMGRKKFMQLSSACEEFRQEGKLTLTYDVVFVRAKK
jgi:malonyl-CoA O-methyltransferase